MANLSTVSTLDQDMTEGKVLLLFFIYLVFCLRLFVVSCPSPPPIFYNIFHVFGELNKGGVTII